MANIEPRGKNTYRFTVYLPKNAKGIYPRERTTYTVEGKFTPKQLEEHLEHEYLKFKSLVLSGNYVRPEAMTFSAFSEEWKQKFASKLAGTTYGNHQRKLELHILPVIGHMDMTKINEFILMNLLDNLERKDGEEGELSYHSEQDVYRTLKSIFKYAVHWRVLKDNPMDGVVKPKPSGDEEEQEIQVYEEEEIAELLDLLQTEPHLWRIMFTLALVAGLRRGELLGLEWSDVDYDNRQIYIRRSIVLTNKGPLIKNTKSKSSKRIVTLPDSMIDELKSYRERWDDRKTAYGDRWEEHVREWVFCGAFGHHIYPSSPTRRWQNFIAMHEVRYIRLHDLRHTSASLLIAQGVHAKIISERLGHSDISVTMNTYGHAFKSADRAAADKLESLFTKK